MSAVCLDPKTVTLKPVETYEGNGITTPYIMFSSDSDVYIDISNSAFVCKSGLKYDEPFWLEARLSGKIVYEDGCHFRDNGTCNNTCLLGSLKDFAGFPLTKHSSWLFVLYSTYVINDIEMKFALI